MIVSQTSGLTARPRMSAPLSACRIQRLKEILKTFPSKAPLSAAVKLVEVLHTAYWPSYLYAEEGAWVHGQDRTWVFGTNWRLAFIVHVGLM